MTKKLCKKIKCKLLYYDGEIFHCGRTSKILERQNECPKSKKEILRKLRTLK